ncbi:MAG: ComF family protein [Treponema sp.]|nr:ComF family protein [Treponema sp.]
MGNLSSFVRTSAAGTRIFLGLRAAVSWLLVDYKCAVCSRPSGNNPVCNVCTKRYFSVPVPDGSICSCCGKKLISENGICMECRTSTLLVHTNGVFPLFSYRLWNENLLCRWKLNGDRGITAFFASLAALRLRQLELMYGELKIVPVPPRPGKIRKQGWDQIQELTSVLCSVYGFSVCNLLERRSEIQQKTLDREERLRTIGNGYFIKEDCGTLPSAICIVDDVLTTGATIESCAAKLKEAGVSEVFAMTLFSVDR